MLADRLEYGRNTTLLLAGGFLPTRRATSSAAPLQLIENSGDADAVYGVLDFDSSEVI